MLSICHGFLPSQKLVALAKSCNENVAQSSKRDLERNLIEIDKDKRQQQEQQQQLSQQNDSQIRIIYEHFP